ncbi:MAG: hypothetical protein U1E83_08295 [Methylotetracoccus sp.]
MSMFSDEIAETLAAIDTSPWLREALLSALQRDPLSAANDAERLAHLLMRHAEALLFLDDWRAGEEPPGAAERRV